MEIINEPREIEIHGYSGQAVNKDYKGLAFKFMDKMWQTVKQHNLPNKRINIGSMIIVMKYLPVSNCSLP